jgi:hypothetical protein
MVPPVSPDMIRECLEFLQQFGYYYVKKQTPGEGETARPQRLSCRAAHNPVAQVFFTVKFYP